MPERIEGDVLADASEGRIDLALQILADIGEVGLTHRVHELALELGRHAAHAPSHLADLAQNARQILGRNRDERDDADDDQLSGIEIEHGLF